MYTIDDMMDYSEAVDVALRQIPELAKYRASFQEVLGVEDNITGLFNIDFYQDWPAVLQEYVCSFFRARKMLARKIFEVRGSELTRMALMDVGYVISFCARNCLSPVVDSSIDGPLADRFIEHLNSDIRCYRP